MSFADTPEPPYYSVVFNSQRTTGDSNNYAAIADRMIELAEQQPGFLGVESVRDASGFGITVSYWKDCDSIESWYQVGEHQDAQSQGRSKWYEQYVVRVCKVERQYSFQDHGEQIEIRNALPKT